MLCCDFLVDESVKIKNDTLKVNYQHLRRLRYSGHLWYVHFFLTKIALIIVYHLTKRISVKWFCQTLGVFHLQWNRMEIFLDFLCFFAVVTLEYVCSFSCVKIINQVSKWMFLDSFLKTIEKHWDKLLNILLHHDIDWLSKWFVCDTESTWREILSCGVFKICKDPLNLME